MGTDTPTNPGTREAIQREATKQSSGSLPAVREPPRPVPLIPSTHQRELPPELRGAPIAQLSPELERRYPPLSDPPERAPDSTKTLVGIRIPNPEDIPEAERGKVALNVLRRIANKMVKQSELEEDRAKQNTSEHVLMAARVKKVAERVGIVLALSVIGPIVIALFQIWSARHPVVTQPAPVIQIVAPTAVTAASSAHHK